MVSTYEDFEALEDDDELKINKKTKNKEDKLKKESKDNDDKKEEDTPVEDDEFNVSLAKMEEEIKPKIINIFRSLKNKNYSKLQKYQKEKLECLLASKELSVSKNKNFKKIQDQF